MLSWERAGERGKAFFLTLDSRGCVGALGGQARRGPQTIIWGGRKWPSGRVFENPALSQR